MTDEGGEWEEEGMEALDGKREGLNAVKWGRGGEWGEGRRVGEERGVEGCEGDDTRQVPLSQGDDTKRTTGPKEVSIR